MYISFLCCILFVHSYFFFFFNDTATTEIYTLSLHDALPILGVEIDLDADAREHRGDGLADRLVIDVAIVRAVHLDLEAVRSEEHTSELQSRLHLVCRLLLEKKKKQTIIKETKSKYYYL